MEFRTKSIFGALYEKGNFQYRTYILQFRVTDFENGFKIGGDIRGALKGQDPAVLDSDRSKS